jgi:hypothetical protein
MPNIVGITPKRGRKKNRNKKQEKFRVRIHQGMVSTQSRRMRYSEVGIAEDPPMGISLLGPA